MNTNTRSITTAPLRRTTARVLAGSIAALLAVHSSHADNTWDGDAGAPFNWGNNVNWGANTAPGYGTLVFAGAVGNTNTMDADYSMNQVNWNGTSAWTLDASGGSVLSLFDFGGGSSRSKLENFSTGLVTINAPVTFAATAGSNWGEINAVSGDMTFGTGTLTVNGSGVAGIRMFGAGRTTTFNNTVSATGKYFSTSAVGTTVGIGGAFTASDLYIMNDGVLNLNTGSSVTAAVRLGGDFGTTGTQDLTKSGTLNLTPAAGGLTFAGVVNSVASNTSGTLAVNSQNTSGTNTLSGQFFLDSALKITQAAGGTLALTNATGPDLKGNTLTLTPASGGSISISGGIINSVGSGSLNMNGPGTLTLSGANTYTGTTLINGGGGLTLTASGLIAAASNIQVNSGTLTIVDGGGGRTLANNMVLNGGIVMAQGTSVDNTGTGGTITYSSGNVIHTFTVSGSLDLPVSIGSASQLIVGAGGGGGAGANGSAYNAGGGGGQVSNLTGQPLASGNTAVTVGAGGAGANNANGTSGGASSIGGNTAAGGLGATGTVGTGGASGSGMAGGVKTGTASGGGGGDSAAGSIAANGSAGGNGGAGSVGTITGSFYGGGGGGSSQGTQGTGGVGGGGNGSSSNFGTIGTANTGGGGGSGVAGGSGIVIVQYLYNPGGSGAVTLSGTIDLQSASTLDAYGTGGLLNVTGLISTSSGAGGLTIASSNNAGGVVRFDSANTYLGNTTVNTGAILRMNAANALPNGSGKGNLSLSGTLDLNAQATTSLNGLSGVGTIDNNSGAGTYALSVGNNDQTSIFGGAIRNTTGTLGLTKAGTGTLTLSGANTYTGATTLTDGVLSVATIGNGGVASGNLASATSAAANLVFNGGKLQYTGATAATNRNFTINANKTATFDITANNLTVTGTAPATNGGLTKAGAGTLTIAAAQVYTGSTTINGGGLTLTAAGLIAAASNIQVNSGTLTITDGGGGRTLANNMVLNGGIVTAQGFQEDNTGTGGAITYSSGNVLHTFTASGTLNIPVAVTASELIVGGGGGAGAGVNNVVYAAGGGGGKVSNLTGQAIASGATAVVVGAGGAGGANAVNGAAGGASSIGANTAAGGLGAPGGGTGGTSGSGNAGGGGYGGYRAGGGGGDSTAGAGGTSNGGAGTVGTITGSFYGGGGGGGSDSAPGVGGVGGGGTGSGGSSQTAGTANTGGGGGAGGTGAAGGSGIIIVQYVHTPGGVVAGTVTLSGTMDLQSASTLNAYGTGGLLNVSGQISTSAGAGGLTIASSNSAGGVVRFDSANTYLGNTTVNTGAILRMNATNALPSGSGKGNLSLSGTLDLNAQATTSLNGLSGAGTIDNNTGAGTYALSVGNNDQTSTFGGAIQNTTGTLGLTKAGTGTLTLSGVNTYTGATTVNAGTLLVSGSISGSAVTVNGGTLGGSGGTTGAVTVGALGSIAPGSSIGTLNTGAVSLSSGATFGLEINTTAATTDLLNITGNFSLAAAGGSVLTISDLSLTAFTSGAFEFISYSGAWDGDFFTYGGNIIADDATIMVGSNSFTLDYNFGGDAVALVAVPEPGSAILLLGGLGAMLGLRRRRA